MRAFGSHVGESRPAPAGGQRDNMAKFPKREAIKRRRNVCGDWPLLQRVRLDDCAAGVMTALRRFFTARADASTRALQVRTEWRSPIEIDNVEHICRNDETHGHQKIPQRFRVALVFGI